MSIRAEALSFGYNSRPVIEDIELEFHGDRIYAILGPNGAGKTTLLKCLCGLLRPDQGRVTVDGEDLSSLTRMEAARRICYVPQRFSATHTTVFDTVLIGRRPHMGWGPSRSDLELTRDALGAVGMESLSMRYVDEISGGELQRALIARAMVQGARTMVLDEPTSSLDLVNQHRTVRLLAEAVRSRGVCTVMTMHDINLAASCSDELVFMKDGRIAARGPPAIITSELIADVYGIEVDVIDHGGLPRALPAHTGPRAGTDQRRSV